MSHQAQEYPSNSSRLSRGYNKAPRGAHASFDGVALLVRLGIEAGWVTAPVAPSRSGADLAGRLRDDLADARRRRWLRTAREEYGRSARTTRGRVRGLPTPLRGTRMRDITVSKAGASRPGLL